MKRLYYCLLLIIIFNSPFSALHILSQTDTVRHEVLLQTSMGDIRIALYNETPKHRDNFLKLVKAGHYDGLIFHRVIWNFMIQTGDTATRHAVPNKLYGDSPEGYKIPAEIHFPQLLHKRGSVAAAREGDETNPQKKSSHSQFYIVWGKRYNDQMMDDVKQKMAEKGHNVEFNDSVRSIYYKKGGTPMLDTQYTVFGEVIEGLDIVNKIQCVDTDENDRPKEDIKIIKASVVR